ncbi:leukocyte cysteine proteinase inhibitor 1-like [Colossoma macropomum]|uniref:leukocyte cysteine proteinase inhibitor 1-like n=1 Tax=Colossoma macropomum TaxID=42526 RepID=UPI0018641112|nr:leukocyte cysteine proteinase inhibitor 1-like [Colossoma macropomum]
MTSDMPGGWTEWREADAEVKDLCKKVKPIVEKKTGKNFAVFEPLTYRTQVVEGTNYDIKVYVGNDTCALLRVWQKPYGEIAEVRCALVPLPSVEFYKKYTA